MGILRATRQAGIVALGHCILERRAEIVPALPEFDFARPAEHAIGQFASAESGEADQSLLLLAGHRNVELLDLAGDQDGRDVHPRPLLPGCGETTILAVFEIEVGAIALFADGRLSRGCARHRRCGRRRRRIGIVVIRRLRCETTEGGDTEAEPGRQRA